MVYLFTPDRFKVHHPACKGARRDSVYGKPKFLYVSKGLEHHPTASISFLNLDWSFAGIGRLDYKEFTELPDKPKKYDQMLRLAEKLAADFPFVRVDLYEIESRIYFSEFTLTPVGGFIPFNPPEWDLKLGSMLRLPVKDYNSTQKSS